MQSVAIMLSTYLSKFLSRFHPQLCPHQILHVLLHIFVFQHAPCPFTYLSHENDIVKIVRKMLWEHMAKKKDNLPALMELTFY